MCSFFIEMRNISKVSILIARYIVIHVNAVLIREMFHILPVFIHIS